MQLKSPQLDLALCIFTFDFDICLYQYKFDSWQQQSVYGDESKREHGDNNNDNNNKNNK